MIKMSGQDDLSGDNTRRGGVKGITPFDII